MMVDDFIRPVTSSFLGSAKLIKAYLFYVEAISAASWV